MARPSSELRREYIKRAQELREQATMAERLLWNALTATRKEAQLKFRRQHPIYPFIADFACVKAKLIIEIDGPPHDVQHDYDVRRDSKLNRQGWTVLRFSNSEVEKNLEGVVLTIISHAKEKLALYALPLTPPVRTGGGLYAVLDSSPCAPHIIR